MYIGSIEKIHSSDAVENIHGDKNDNGVREPLLWSDYSLTIGEASSLMVCHRCKFASNRKVQRMCRDGVIECYKLQTTRNGQPVAEWLVNEASLLKHIEENEIKWDSDTAIVPAADGSARGVANLAPNQIGNTNHATDGQADVVSNPDAMALPEANGDASGGAENSNSVAKPGHVMATPDGDGDASNEDDAFEREVGESRSLASVLIENAKLTAQLEGARNLIEEVRDDKEFLRDELIEARAGRKDVTAIAERMLETLETIAIGGKLMSGSRTRKQDEPTSQKTKYRSSEATRWYKPTNDNSVSIDNNVESEEPNSPQVQPTFRPSTDPENPFRI